MRLWVGLILTLGCAFLVSCQKAEKLDSSQRASQDSLKHALLEIDAGNRAQAEAHLLSSIASNPQNSRSRVILSSLYAERGNLQLQDWLEAFYNAGTDIDSKSRMYHRAEGIVGSFRRDPMRDSKENEDEHRKKINELAKTLGRVSLGIMVTADVFYRLPMISKAQLSDLDRAIQVLLPNDPTFHLSDEGRVYLSILAITRLVSIVKQQIRGHEDLEGYLADPHSVCSTPPEELRATLIEIRQSLKYLSEGLRIYPDEPMNKPREIRQRVRDFVSKQMESAWWDKVDLFFQTNTHEYGIGLGFISDFCFFEGVTGVMTSDGEAPIVPEAHLFIPD